jgi:hypothetical protein
MKKTFTIIGLLGGICAVIGLLSVIGYVFGIQELYKWEAHNPGMALNSAIEFVIIGSIILYRSIKLGNGSR